ncbi:MAG: prolipoprotein diacylglyceryl transferase [Sebaldella sp.]|nr:prolipoprotein diacylglyceryl transferase [Sebaldella sp.]
MKSYIDLGFIKIHYYSLMYIIAFFLGIFIATRDKVAQERGIKDKKVIEDFAFWVMISGLIGARLYYVLFKLGSYMERPLSIFAVWEGGLAIHGGIIGAFIGAVIFAKRKKMNLWVLTDMGVGPLLIGQAIGRIGNYANGEIEGVPTFTPWSVILKGNFEQWWSQYLSMSIDMKSKFKELVPWGVVFPSGTSAGDSFPNVPLHPAMLYESVLNVIGFFLLWFYFRKKGYKPGILSMIYLIMYALIRSFVSFFRVEDLSFFGVIRAPHLISIIMLILAFIGIKFLSKKDSK